MAILALYIPKPEELTISITHLAIAYFVLCAMAFRMKLSVPTAAALTALVSAIAIAPDIYAASQENLGSYGDMAREASNTNYSDAFFAVTGYMYVGRGKPLAFAGMSVAIVIYAAAVKGWRRRQLFRGKTLQGQSCGRPTQSQKPSE